MPREPELRLQQVRRACGCLEPDGGCLANEDVRNLIADLVKALEHMVFWHIERGPFDEPLGASEQSPEIRDALAALAKAKQP
jgi:hypothetical protein